MSFRGHMNAVGRSSAGSLAALALLVLGVLLLAAATASGQGLQGSVAPGVTFPNRTLILSIPSSVSPSASSVHITENGQPVRSVSTNSLRQGGPGDLGVVLVIDTDPSMQGAPLDHALAAARNFAAQRTGAEEIGVVFGDGVSLPLTSDGSAIDQALASPPQGHGYRDLIAMTQQAVAELSSARIVDRAIIYVTDDIDRERGWTPQSIGAYARSAHVRIFTVGVRDAIWTHPLPGDLPSPQSIIALANAAGGTYSGTTPSQERRAFLDIEAGLLNQYVVHYRSLQPYGRTVNVTVQVDGVAGTLTTSYRSPPRPVAAPAVTTSPAKKGFWKSSLAVAVIAVGAAILIALAIALITSQFARSGQLRHRVQAFVPPPPEAARRAGGGTAVELTGSVERLLERRQWWPEFVAKVAISGIDRSPTELAYFAIAGSLVAAALVQLITNSIPFAIIALIVGPLVVRAIVNRGVRNQRIKFMEQLPGQLHEIAGAMRAGRSMVEAFGVVADGADEPMHRELSRAVADERAGVHLEEALLPISDRMESTEIEQVAVVAGLHRRTGANVTEVLDRVADTARERVEIRRELRSLTAQARLSRNILTALPVVVVVAIDLIAHQYEKPLFHTTAGVAVLVIAAVMIMIGYWIMKAIVNIEE